MPTKRVRHERWRESRKKDSLLGLALSSVILIPAGLLVLFGVLAILLGAFRELAPDGLYDRVASRLLGTGYRTTYSIDLDNISPEVVAILEEENIQPQSLANVLAGLDALNKFVGPDKVPQPSVGMEMPLITRRNESANGTNMGSSPSAKRRVCAPENDNRLSTPTYSFCKAQSDAIRWLLAHWQKHDIRSKNPVAAEYIKVDENGDYHDWISHGVGEAGIDGWLPSTLKKECEVYLSLSDDPEIASCDPWSGKVSTAGAIHYLYACGYSDQLSREQQISEMTCWNRSVPYVTKLVDQAIALRAKFAAVSDFQFEYTASESSVVRQNEFQIILTGMLNEIGMMPRVYRPGLPGSVSLMVPGELEAQEWLSIPVSDPTGKSQDYHSGHLGFDFGCKWPADAVAVASGYIANPNDPKFKLDGLTVETGTYGWGIPLWIYHGNGLHTTYWHLEEVYVQYGQWVEKGTPIGLCGHTGYSYTTRHGYTEYNTKYSNHVHFEVEITTSCTPMRGAEDWVGIQRLNPGFFLGKTVDPGAPPAGTPAICEEQLPPVVQNTGASDDTQPPDTPEN